MIRGGGGGGLEPIKFSFSRAVFEKKGRKREGERGGISAGPLFSSWDKEEKNGGSRIQQFNFLDRRGERKERGEEKPIT